MINLYLLKYNNYYNRKIKKEQTIQEYANYILASFNNIYTFDYADGVNTSHVLPYKGETPDYAIVTEEDESGIEEIKYRWFVVESSYIRGGKYRVSLRRDLIADNLEEVLDAPCMVEKGYINDDQGNRQVTLLNRRTVNLKNVRIKDNETLIIGGLMKETDSKTVSKIPFLGDIPIIGAIFRSSSTTKDKSELVIMLTPKILKDAEDIGVQYNSNYNDAL